MTEPFVATHGRSRTPEYRVWQQLRQRCLNPRAKSFDNYGGRGVTVCDRWNESFQAFIDDMGARPSPYHSIDRIDNDGPYEPKNCRWAEMRVQLRNRRTNSMLTFLGRTQTVTDWAAELGIAAPTLDARLQRGWSLEKALSTLGESSSRKKHAHRMLTYNGETLSLAEWNRRLGCSPTTILCRLKNGWSVERALATPVHR